MNLLHNSNPSATASANNAAPRKMGIHITLPPLAFWIMGGVEIEMLSRSISIALNRRKLLIGEFQMVVFDRQVLSLVEVASLGMALSTVSAELSAVKLITGAHLAWVCENECVWRSDRPIPEPMPFSRHIDAFLAWDTARKAQTSEQWSQEAAKFINNATAVVAKLQKRQSSQSGNQPSEGAL